MNDTIFLAGLAVGAGIGTVVFASARRLAGVPDTRRPTRSPGEFECDSDS